MGRHDAELLHEPLSATLRAHGLFIPADQDLEIAPAVFAGIFVKRHRCFSMPREFRDAVRDSKILGKKAGSWNGKPISRQGVR